MRLIATGVGLLVLTGCSESSGIYESVQDEERNTYVLNRWTGSMYRVESDALIPLRRSAPDPDYEALARELELPYENWVANDALHVDARARYRDGELFISGTLRPQMPREISEESPVFATVRDEHRGIIVYLRIDWADLFVLGTAGYGFSKRVAIDPRSYSYAHSLIFGWDGIFASALEEWINTDEGRQALEDAREAIAESARQEETPRSNNPFFTPQDFPEAVQ